MMKEVLEWLVEKTAQQRDAEGSRLLLSLRQESGACDLEIC